MAQIVNKGPPEPSQATQTPRAPRTSGAFDTMETCIENFRLDRRQDAVGAASCQYSDSSRSLMDECRRLFQSSQAPDFRVRDLLHVQSWQYHSSVMLLGGPPSHRIFKP